MTRNYDLNQEISDEINKHHQKYARHEKYVLYLLLVFETTHPFQSITKLY